MRGWLRSVYGFAVLAAASCASTSPDAEGASSGGQGDASSGAASDAQEEVAVADAAAADATGEGATCRTFEAPASTRQLIAIHTATWDALTGMAQRWTRSDGAASFCPLGDPQPVVVGRAGLGWGRGLFAPLGVGPQKQEGDGKSPAGTFRLGTAFGTDPDFLPAHGWPYRVLTPHTVCVDDSNSAFYNQIVEAEPHRPPAWSSGEQMASYTTAYRLGIVVEHNAPSPVAGAGSCIFIHVGTIVPPEPTVGCTALPHAALSEWVDWLIPAADPILVQLPEPFLDEW